MQQKKNTYHLMRLKCGNYFDYSSSLKKYCPECDAELRKERSKKCMQKKRAKNTVKFKTLTEVMRELKAYNEEHGTHLTYGQYISMCEGA